MKKKMLSFLMVIMMLVAMLPVAAFADEPEMSDAFKEYLNEDGALVINTIKPTTAEERDFFMLEYMLMMTDYQLEVLVDTYDEETSTCDVLYFGDTDEMHNVKIVFNYDEDVLAATKELVKTLPDEKTVFMVSDMELINYWMSRTGELSDEIGGGLDNFSTQLKEALGNKNYSFFVDQRAGADCMFMTERLGIAMLMHEGVAYYYDDMLGTRAEHVIYIPEDTADTKEAILAAVQNRIDDYVGEGKVEVAYGGQGALNRMTRSIDAMIAAYDAQIAEKEAVYQEYSNQILACENRINEIDEKIIELDEEMFMWQRIVDDMLYSNEERAEAYAKVNEIAATINDLTIEKGNVSSNKYSLEQQQQFYRMSEIVPLESSKSNKVSEKEYYVREYEEEDGAFYFLHDAAGDYWFTVTINDVEYYCVAMKDDDKMLTPTYTSADIKTEVTVSSSDTSVPLDTKIDVDELTSGATYNKIVDILDVEENQTFDISLYSSAKGANITKLEDGTFEVLIPVSEALAGKSLVAYYVDENDEVVEYEVTVEDGYAKFATNHFSIYTIAEENNSGVTPPPTGDSTSIVIWMLLLAVGGCVVACGMKSKKYI